MTVATEVATRAAVRQSSRANNPASHPRCGARDARCSKELDNCHDRWVFQHPDQGDVACAAVLQLAAQLVDVLMQSRVHAEGPGDSCIAVLNLSVLCLGDDEEHLDGAAGAYGTHLAGDFPGVRRDCLSRI